MKKTFASLAAFFLCLTLAAQELPETEPPLQIGLKWAPTGLIVGSVSLQGEYNFGRNSLTAKIGIPANTKRNFNYEDRDARFSMKATSFLAGYRRYLSKKYMRGLYLEPYFKYVHHTAEGEGTGTLANEPVLLNFTNDYNGFGVGAQLGVQFQVRKRFLIDLFFLGPEINTANNRFKAVEVSDALPWTSMQAAEAEQDIRDFLDNFPFIRNNTDVMVDRANKTVTADFKGFIPGYRAGISFGFRL